MSDAGIKQESAEITITYCIECDLKPVAEKLAAAIKSRFGLAAKLEEGHGGIYEVRIDGDVVFNNFDQGGRLPADAQIFLEIRKRAEAGTLVCPMPPGSWGEQVVAMNPMGYPPAIEQVHLAPRPSSLDGKTVYLVDARFDDSDRLLLQMQNWFTEHMPQTKTVFVSKDGVYTRDDPRLFQEIKENGDAMIMGVGH